MTRLRKFAMILAAGAAGAALAQSGGGDYLLNSTVVAGGGGRSVGGDYEIAATLGQHDAGGAQSGGDFVLAGGVHPGANALSNVIFLNGFEG